MWLVMLIMCVVRFMSFDNRCLDSPTPGHVGVDTLCPAARSSSATFFQHQPPYHAPCTRTKVLRFEVTSLPRANTWLAADAPMTRPIALLLNFRRSIAMSSQTAAQLSE